MREEELLKDEIDGFFSEKISNDLFPIKEEREGKSVYHYVLVNSDKRKMVREQFKAGSISVEKIKDYSQILYSGWGRDLLESISDRIKRAFISSEENFKLTFDNDLYNTARNCGLEEVKKLFEKKVEEKNEADENGWTCLHHAAFGGDLEVVDYLVNSCHVDLDITDKVCSRGPVHIAAREGHIAIVEFFLSKIKIDVIDGNKWTLLHYAAYGNHLKIAQLLIDAKIDVHARDARGMEPIHVAVENGCKDVIKFLLDKDIGINDVDSKDRTPLYYAVRKGDLKMVEFLVNEGASICARRKDGKEPIHTAIEEDNVEIVKFFLSKRASVDDAGENDWRLLHYAARMGSLEVAEFLINQRDSIYARDANGMTPMHVAAESDHVIIVELFFNKSKNINDVDSKGRTPLYYAVREGNLEMVEFLVDKGADIYGASIYAKKKDSGPKFIHVAAEMGHTDVIKYFLGKNININADDGKGYMPLHYAVRKGDLKMVEFLVDEGADTDKGSFYGVKPIHIAVQENHKDIIQCFLTKDKSGINSIDSLGYTPLHYAVRNNNLGMVEFLVDRGADIKAKNFSGKEPIDIASDASIIGFLKSKVGNTTDLKDVHVKKMIMVNCTLLDNFNSKSSDDMASDCSEHNSVFESSEEEIATDYSMPETNSQLLPLKRRADVLEQQPKPKPEPQSKLSKVEKEEAKEQCIAEKVDGNPRTHLQDFPSASGTMLNIHERSSGIPRIPEPSSIPGPSQSNLEGTSIKQTRIPRLSRSPRPSQSNLEGTSIEQKGQKTGSQLLPSKRRASVSKPLGYEPQSKLSKVEKGEAKGQYIAGKVGGNSRTHLQDSSSASGTTPNIHERSSKTPMSSFLQPPQSNLEIEQTRIPIPSRIPIPPQSCLEDTNVEQGGKGGKGGKEPWRL